ncbi:ArsS family sensor histidine kinase [Helicobacter sp. MIT 21-1697]|uniref:ArsS family sensor histidine kinase n=1 Tax=Helicobacter sp. MIT 21-1697 TaxID=2993733 RepID=UPI00224B8773|nr:ArsS family sensor histidine kinase [Helicobacter sp. MIT 21-1697]MCX2717278.1 ArsS family sensor histidine kinase [Helicobacter sp. MIT 21-1697]
MFQFRHSIFFKIVILFLCALFGFFAISYYFIQDHIENENLLSEFRYKQFTATINEIMQYGGNINIIKQYLQSMQFVPAEEEKIKEVLQEVGKLPEDFSGVFAKAINTQNGIYILLESQNETILYKDDSRKLYEDFYIITLIGIILLTFVFFIVLKSLMPLKILKGQVKQFAEGNFNTQYEQNTKDEIGELYHEFYKASNKIKSLNESRSLLLRSIMHELKTPITKGRIVAEMVQDSTQKQQLCSAFTRLNELINEFAKLEQITSKNYQPNKQEFLLQDLISHTEDMLLIDESSPITLNSPHALIKADFDLFVIALKNLLDNAIKYSSDGKVSVYTKNDRLYTSSQGEPLQYELKTYFKPYFKNHKNPSSQGFGLGMYIIKNTLDNQGFNLSYKHENGYNIFIIHHCVVENYCLVDKKPK